MAMTEPMPMTIPRLVKKDRPLWTHKARRATRTVAYWRIVAALEKTPGQT
jgi:hypothetical protein